MSLITFEDAHERVPAGTVPHLLLGNGFSRACRDDIFAYSALFDRADFNQLSPRARHAFDLLQTTDFERVMLALRDAARLVGLYLPGQPCVGRQLQEDADGLREVLVQAVADNHPEFPAQISDSSYASCRRFLARFDRIYTLNYDLLLYWALMQSEIQPTVRSDDGFRAPGPGQHETYVTWEPGRHGQKVYYLHGALHIFDAALKCGSTLGAILESD